MPDAVVIGSGPNGLVAANLLADAGWDVLVLEAESEPGGGTRSAEWAAPGFVHDVCATFFPLSAASPAIRALELEAHGLRWLRHPLPVAHPARDGTVALISSDLDETCASLDAFAAGDGDAFRRLYATWERLAPAIAGGLVTPFPPLRAGARAVARLGGLRGALDFARFGLLPIRRFADEEFRGEGAARLLAGNAMHSDLMPETPGSSVFAFVLCGLAQQVGFPVAAGGSRSFAGALVRRLEARGGRVRCSAPAARVEVRGGRARAVRTADGDVVVARRAVLAAVSAPLLYGELLADVALPQRVRSALRRFQWDAATFKVDWALDGPVPWLNAQTARAGTVHVVEGIDALTRGTGEIARGLIPAEPFLVLGQYALADGERQPAGCETVYGYTHVPQVVRGDAGPDGLLGTWDRGEAELFANRMEAQVEAVAPGFRARIRARHVTTPGGFERHNRNLAGGALMGGTTQLHQQLIFRPLPGLGRSETPVAGLYLASASAHPGGGVHGGPGAIAARAALRERGPLRHAAARIAAAAVSDGRPYSAVGATASAPDGGP